MFLKDLSGKEVTATLSTNHPTRRYGQAVLVVNGKAYGTADVVGWQLIKATTEEREALKKAGYGCLLQVKVTGQ